MFSSKNGNWQLIPLTLRRMCVCNPFSVKKKKTFRNSIAIKFQIVLLPFVEKLYFLCVLDMRWVHRVLNEPFFAVCSVWGLYLGLFTSRTHNKYTKKMCILDFVMFLFGWGLDYCVIGARNRINVDWDLFLGLAYLFRFFFLLTFVWRRFY